MEYIHKTFDDFNEHIIVGCYCINTFMVVTSHRGANLLTNLLIIDND